MSSTPTRSLPPSDRRRLYGYALCNVVLTALTLLAYHSASVSPARFWPAAFMGLALPGLWLLNGAAALGWLWLRPVLALWPVGLLLLGSPFVGATFAVTAPAEAPAGAATFKVLSYNVSTFIWGKQYRKDIGIEQAAPMIDWLTHADADVLCLQEFYNNDTSLTHNTIERLTRAGWPYYFMTPVRNFYPGGGFHSVAVFSRHPLARGGDVVVGRQSELNRGQFVDVCLGADTVRVYNLHLESMTIRADGLFAPASPRTWWGRWRTALGKIKRGTRVRGAQVDQLVAHVAGSPYPVVVSGDLNDLPYSYTYHTLRLHLHSTFERAGRGFGFTYNGRLFFLQLDHQFYSPALRALRFRTHRQVPYSEHFPIEGIYALPPAHPATLLLRAGGHGGNHRQGAPALP